MKKIELHQPSGQYVVNPSKEYVKELILHKGKKYWHAGSGSGGISFYEEGKEKFALILIMDASKRFYLEYIEKEANIYDPFVPLNNVSSEDVVTVYVGGNQHKLPEKTFISREQAWIAIECFLEYGIRTEQIKWIRSSEIDWPDDENDDE